MKVKQYIKNFMSKTLAIFLLVKVTFYILETFTAKLKRSKKEWFFKHKKSKRKHFKLSTRKYRVKFLQEAVVVYFIYFIKIANEKQLFLNGFQIIAF